MIYHFPEPKVSPPVGATRRAPRPTAQRWLDHDGLDICVANTMQVFAIGIVGRNRILGQQRQIGTQRQDPPRRQIERVVQTQIERFGRDVAKRSLRAAASRSRPVLFHHLKQICRRSEEIFAGVETLIGRRRNLGGCYSRPQDHGSEKASAEECAADP
jgi:hypothetical protein